MKIFLKSNALIIMFFILMGLIGCNAKSGDSQTIKAETLDQLPYDLTVQQVSEAYQTGEVMILDVREIWEYEEGHIPDAVLIPMMEVENRLSEIPKDQHVIVTCRSGNRSSQVAEFLSKKGYTKVHNMLGGILDWKAAGLPVEQK